MTETLCGRGTRAEVLLQLARSKALETGDFDAFSTEMCAVVASTLSVERVGVWMFSEDRRILRCVCGYRHSDRSYDAGMKLLTADFPDYFTAIREGRGVAVGDVLNDPITHAFIESYLISLGIGAALDVPIRRGGAVVGIVSLEHVGETRSWSEDEQDFAASLADLGALVLEAAARRAATENYHKLEARLFHAQKMDTLGKLAGGVAHDFSNLLTTILGHAELLEETLAGAPTARTHLGEIQRAAERASTLTRRLLAFSRTGGGAREQVDLNETVQRLGTLLGPILGRKIRLESRLAPNLPPVMMEVTQIEQVLVNLGVNAREAMPDGGSIEFSTSWVAAEDAEAEGIAPHGWIRLTVRDTGSGIAPEHLSRVFEPFFTTKPSGTGMGLGLATARMAINEVGGTIVARNASPGVRLDVRIPAAERSSHSGVSSSAARPGVGTETVLVCEEDAAARDVTERVLSAGGYRVMSAARGEQAVEIAAVHEGPIDLLVTDLVLPEMRGEQLAEQLSRSHPGLRVLFMSVLQKPYTPTDFLQMIRDVLDRR